MAKKLNDLGPYPKVKIPQLPQTTEFNILDNTYWINAPCQTLYVLKQNALRQEVITFGLEPGDSSTFIDHVTNFSTKKTDFQSIHPILYTFQFVDCSCTTECM